MMNPAWSVDGVRDHYDRISLLYLALWGEHIHHGWWVEGETAATAQVRLIERLADRAGLPHGAHVLDVGCGLGGSSRWLAKNLHCSVVGLTISPVQAAIARWRARASGLGRRTRFFVMDANRLQFPAESFDAVWVIECSEHLADKPRFIERCARLLRPGGVLALCAWLAPDEPTAAEQALVSDICRGMFCPALASMREYAAWMRTSGFDEIRAEDISRDVRKTWDHCRGIIGRPLLRALLRWSDPGTRRFIQTFATMQRAYAEGALSYGMFAARKVPVE
jgi:tocopherol O-methyltransferase